MHKFVPFKAILFKSKKLFSVGRLDKIGLSSEKLPNLQIHPEKSFILI